MPAARPRILRGKSVAIGGPRVRPPQRGAVHRSSTLRLLSVLQRPYWSPPPRSLLPTLIAAGRSDDFPRSRSIGTRHCRTVEIFPFLLSLLLFLLKLPGNPSLSIPMKLSKFMRQKMKFFDVFCFY